MEKIAGALEISVSQLMQNVQVAPLPPTTRIRLPKDPRVIFQALVEASPEQWEQILRILGIGPSVDGPPPPQYRVKR